MTSACHIILLRNKTYLGCPISLLTFDIVNGQATIKGSFVEASLIVYNSLDKFPQIMNPLTEIKFLPILYDPKPRGARRLDSGPSLHLHPNFAYASSESSRLLHRRHMNIDVISRDVMQSTKAPAL